MNYKKEYKNKVAENVNNVLTELNTEQMRVKIVNWANKFGYSFDAIKEKIINDEIFRCIFAKDPNKQNLHQNLAAKYIESLSRISNFKILPSGGDNAIYLTNGKIFEGQKLKHKSKDIKSIDFTWNTSKYKFYASHKYTNDEGGAQDNQYKDIQDFLNHARDCNEKNVIFLAICDGDYYLRKDAKTGDTSRLDRLQRLTDNKTSFVLNINDLASFLQKYS